MDLFAIMQLDCYSGTKVALSTLMIEEATGQKGKGSLITIGVAMMLHSIVMINEVLQSSNQVKDFILLEYSKE